MPTQATVRHILLARPADIGEEQSVSKDVVIDWNAISGQKKGVQLEPILFPDHVDSTSEALDRADFVLGTFWSQIGDLAGDGLNAANVIQHLSSRGSQRSLGSPT